MFKTPNRLLQARPLTGVLIASVLVVGSVAGGAGTANAAELTAATTGVVASSVSPSCITSPSSPSSPSEPQDEGYVTADGDYVHESGGQASAHGWWDYVSGNQPPAGVTVTVQLQEKLPGTCGGPQDVGTPGRGVVKYPGGGTANRITAKVTCANASVTLWQSVVTAVVDGAVSSVPPYVSPAQEIPCRT